MTISGSQMVPINIVGSSVFGRYPKISNERTYNMFISDEWLVSYAGFKKVLEILGKEGEGRGIFHSVRGNFFLAVFSSSVYRISDTLAVEFLGNIETDSGEVTIDNNLSSQFAICDGENIYIYSSITNSITVQDLTITTTTIKVIPNYVIYHNTFFLIASNPKSENPQNWYVARRKTDTTIEITEDDQFTLQTKPDNAIAVKRLPGRGNNVIVFGSSVAEIWTQVGGEEN
jgi:hypothetical protein